MISMKNSILYHDNRRGCYGIVLLAIVMAIIGIVMQYSASMYSATKDMGDEFYYVKKQSVALVFSIISMLFFSHFRVEILRKYRYYILIASYILRGEVWRKEMAKSRSSHCATIRDS